MNVLVVEDEKTNFLYIKRMLEENEINVYWAENGINAVKMAESYVDFHFILMDIKMPEMNGFDATKIIKSKNPKQIVIALTAYSRPEDRTRFMEAGFDDYLTKPIRPNDFRHKIRRYL